ncbi:fibropellin-1-like isoform X2 [Ruditapes philippinarum]|uniref:fibropellin-1-like isoform X2 n=1 Tax=Ruditapes philippinarum TaxID=129788 RepID=UPI00295B39C7|nr:fibropellin-1-like isoform X2 [Ruditapes philippinarum]
MDNIMLYILFLFHGFIFGGAETDQTDCKNGPKYDACVCSGVPIDPPYGSIELVDQTQGTYKCNKGFALKVYAIIRCLKGGRDRPNYWNESKSACTAIDDCNPSPCFNADICIDEIEDYTCLCLPGYTGKNCSEKIISSVKTEPSSIKTTKTTASRQPVMTSTVIATSISVTGETDLDTDKESPVYIWYIVGATVVCILGIILVVAAVRIVRRRRLATKQTPDRNDDTSEQVPEYTELDITQANSNPYSALSKISNRYARDKIDSMNSDAAYLTPCASTNPDVSNEYISIDA